MEESGIDETNTSTNDKILECYGDQLSLIEKRFKEFKDNIEADEYKPEKKQKILQFFKEEINKITDGIEKIISEEEIEFSEDEMDQLSNVYFGLKKVVEKIVKFLQPEQTKDQELPQMLNIPMPAEAPLQPQIALGTSNQIKMIKSATIMQNNIAPILKAFGESAVLAINKLHPLSYIKSIYKNNETEDYTIIIAESNKDIISLKFNNNVLLNEIIPLQNECCRNIYANNFLQHYWLPIIYSVGHFKIRSSTIVPNYNLSHKKICGFNQNGKKIVATIDIKNENKKLGIQKSWWIKIAQEDKKIISNFKEKELINAEVICIDKTLPIYYQHSGQVLSVIQRDDYIDLIIDFRRGLDKLILRDDQVNIVKLLG